MPGVVLSAYSAVALDHAADVLRSGQLVVVPTDTVYGLSAALTRPDAVAKIYEVKQRPPERPIALLVDQVDEVDQVAASIPDVARLLMEKFWPGGLTIILPKKPDIPDVITAAGPTIAVRMPDHPVPRALIRRMGMPLPTTSANRHGMPSPKSAQDAAGEIGPEVAIILDAGPAPGGIDSTVVDVTGDQIRVLRAGAISASEIEAALGKPVVG